MDWQILFLEDENVDFKIMERLLAPEFELLRASTGEEALNLIENDRENRIRVVLLDVELRRPGSAEPLPMQGGEVALKIKKLRPEIPILVVSKGVNINAPIQGYYWKGILFESEQSLEDFKYALRSLVYKSPLPAYYPSDGGGEVWRDKWGPDYLKIRGNPLFEGIERFIGSQALRDYQLLQNNQLARGQNYWEYRGTETLMDVLIARRVILASAFDSLRSTHYNHIDWHAVSSFLGFEANDRTEIWGLMHECGINWGGIVTKDTLLQEEEIWLQNNGFYG